MKELIVAIFLVIFYLFGCLYKNEICEDRSIVRQIDKSRISEYKYRVLIAEPFNEYYLFTNTEFLVGDTIKYNR